MSDLSPVPRERQQLCRLDLPIPITLLTALLTAIETTAQQHGWERVDLETGSGRLWASRPGKPDPSEETP